MTTTATRPASPSAAPAVVRFAGDSGDGIQLTGLQFTRSAARAGAGFMTFPDFPAEIRAPAGTTFGVSAYQIQFGSGDVLTHGDEADVLVAFNPAALVTNLNQLRPGGTVIVDEGAFDNRGLKKAGAASNPLEDGSLGSYRVFSIDITRRTLEAVSHLEIGRKQSGRSKNFWVLGLVLWMFGQDRTETRYWIAAKFGKDPQTRDANLAALDAGHAYGETMELAIVTSPPAQPAAAAASDEIISGTEAMARGISAAAELSGRDVIYCSYPITPASALLHSLARPGSGVKTFQAEDEIAAACAAIGASYGGAIGVTASSGPGLALKTEALGLAVAAELPLLVFDVQRAGPSTGMPTKPEQSDLTMAILGRHGEAPCPVLAPATPSECYDTAIEAARIATEAMTPVIVLSDAYLANAVTRWSPPELERMQPIARPGLPGPEDFNPYMRDPGSLSRPWVSPGTPGLAHRIGGLEKAAGSGHISYDPGNHAEMTRLRADKIERISGRRPPASIETGVESGELLVIGWGSTWGAIRQAVQDLNAAGRAVGHLHLRQLWPFPRGVGEILSRFERVVCAELNSGQMALLLRATYLTPVEALGQVTGQPFRVADIKAQLELRLKEAAA
ncbi:MAG: 2-oxoacid:acceptor oxidoreductase subunit alpha [Hyphomicrobiales bacterium]